MLGISFLDKIVKQNKISDTGMILDELRKEVIKSMHQTGKRNEEKNGMDISVCVIDKKQNMIQYSGAFNNLCLFKNSELLEYKADKMPIGIYEEAESHFSRHDIQADKGDIFYMFSDGYADQFGGTDHKKLGSASFKSILKVICGLPLETQRKKLETEFFRWKGNEPQTDDVMVIGLRI
jgi:serine phosphatase RsbU (regulator of sigma subunit)